MFTSSDGRRVGYDDVGDPRGMPVVYLHGTPDSRLARHPDDTLVAQAGLRLVAVDRPGYGASSPPDPGMPASQVNDVFARDLVLLLDHLDIARARLVAWSGGALTALAVAAVPSLADRLTELVVIAGLVPPEAFYDPVVRRVAPERRDVIEYAAGMPPAELAELVAPVLAPHPCDRPLAVEHQEAGRRPEDRAALAAVPGGVERMADALVEAVRNGLAGVSADVIVQHYPGTVEPAAVTLPVRLRYGALDEVAPPAFGTWYADHLPHADLTVVEGAGHFLPFTHWPAVLGDGG